jgi:hypothetical protein
MTLAIPGTLSPAGIEQAFGPEFMLKCQIQTLRQTRDLLLPRLLSGQVALNFSAMPVSSKA